MECEWGKGDGASVTLWELTGAVFRFATSTGFLYQLQRSADLSFDTQSLEIVDQAIHYVLKDMGLVKSRRRLAKFLP
jgi:hypothetical protein